MYHNGSSAAHLLIVRVEEVEYATFSLGAFLRAVQYDPASSFAHDQVLGACVEKCACLREPGVLVGDFASGYFVFSMKWTSNLYWLSWRLHVVGK